ncbi:MAG: hypothetical protein ACYTAS_14895 [Planctomycetota bacterium]
MHVLLLIVIAPTVAGVLFVWMTSIRSYQVPGNHVLARMADIAPGAWERLNNKKIFFGRHSVGRDIIQGIRDVMAVHPSLRLRIVNTKDVEQIGDAILAHAGVGRNFDPMSKIVEFETLMYSGLGEKVDIAFFKLCFVDIASTSDPDSVLAAYCEAMTRLRRRYPKTVFVHVTVPLGGPPDTAKGILKASIKRLIGRPPVLADNQMRARYNALLRDHFAEREPVFDLALYETLGPEGQRHYSMWNDREVPILARMYTDDGGHLNALGRRHVAEQLLINLARLPEANDS